MAAALRIAAKDLRQRLRDRSAVMLAVVLPLALAFIYSSLFGSASTPRAFEYAVVDLDRGAVAQSFVGDVLGDIHKQGFVTVRSSPDVAAARRSVEKGDLDAAFVLPPGFSAAVQTGAVSTIDVIGNVDSPTGTDVARSIAGSFVTDLNAVRLSVATAVGDDHDTLTADELAAVAGRAVRSARPLLIADVSATAKVLDLKTYMAAGMAVFFLFFTVQFGVASLLDERAEGTLARLLAAPVRPVSVLAGKLLASIVVGVASTAVLVYATTVLMRISWGDPLGVAVLVVAGVLAATGARIVRSVAGLAPASVRRTHSIVAIRGWIIPTPLAMPLTVTWRSPPSPLSGPGSATWVDAIFALHVDPTRRVGTVGLRSGVFTASCDALRITVAGRGGHAARSHESTDPIAAAAQLISTFYQFIPRATDSQDAVVVSFGQIHGGQNANVIPEQVVLEGTVRTLDRKVDAILEKRRWLLSRGKSG